MGVYCYLCYQKIVVCLIPTSCRCFSRISTKQLAINLQNYFIKYTGEPARCSYFEGFCASCVEKMFRTRFEKAPVEFLQKDRSGRTMRKTLYILKKAKPCCPYCKVKFCRDKFLPLDVVSNDDDDEEEEVNDASSNSNGSEPTKKSDESFQVFTNFDDDSSDDKDDKDF